MRSSRASINFLGRLSTEKVLSVRRIFLEGFIRTYEKPPTEAMMMAAVGGFI